MRVKILASYGGDLHHVAKDIEKKINELLTELEKEDCTIHRVDVSHQMMENSFSILALIVYTCHDAG